MEVTMEDRIDFTDILQRSRELRDLQEASTRGFSDSIPRLERALPQIDTESRRLVAENLVRQPDTSASDQEAILLLSESGIPTGNLAKSLKTGAVLEDAFMPYSEPPDTDVAGHLERLQEDVIVEAMGKALEYAKEVARQHIATRSDADWDATKRDRIAVQSIHPVRQTPSKRLSSTPSGVFASPFRFARESDTRNTSAKAPLFQSVVEAAVHSRSEPTRAVNVATLFDDALVAALAPRGDIRNAPRNVRNLHAVFTALRYIAGEANATSPREGEYGGLFLPQERRRAILGGLKFLCLQFREETLRYEVATNPVQAARGGIPGIESDVRAFLNIRYSRGWPSELADGPLLQDIPLWAQVYYCLRCGDVVAAHRLVQQAVNIGTYDKSVALFERCVSAYIASGESRQVPHDLLEEMVHGYGSFVRRNVDPYQRFCFVVIARLDPFTGDKMALEEEDVSYLTKSIEDHLWLKLNLARLDEDMPLPRSLSSYAVTLRSVQEEMHSFGPAHFDPRGDQAVFYAHVLILTGQYSAAIEYLDNITNSHAEAFHIAFVLYYYGMLRDATNEDNEETHQSGALTYDCLAVNYTQVLWRYVARIAASDVAVSVVYLFTVRDSDKRNDLLKRLLLETKELKLLVGAAGLGERDGVFGEKCVFEELWPLAGREGVTSGGWLGVAEAAAETAEESGDALTAISLYNVCRKYGRVSRLLIDRLAAELTSRGTPLRSQIEVESKAFQDKMKRNVMDARRDVMLEMYMPSLDVLLRLYRFLELTWAKDFTRAWNTLQETEILPQNEVDLMAKTQELRPGNNRWDDKLCDRIPDVVLAAMECLVGMYMETQREMAGPSAAQRLRGLKEASRVLINFSAMMPGSSADLSARLMRYEVMLS